MRWFTSDQHFGHRNIIRYSGRPFASVAEMDDALVQRYNQAVAPDDEVFWLGDVAMGQAEFTVANVAICHGRKTLVVGNHDRVFAVPGARRQPNPRWTSIYSGVGFDPMVQGFASLRLSDGTTVLMCHFPYLGDSHDEDRFDTLRPPDNGQWLIHGHVHEKWRQRGRQINAGVDAWGGRPVSETEICELIAAGPADRDVLPW